MLIFKALKNITNRKFWQIIFVCLSKFHLSQKKNSGVIGTLKVGVLRVSEALSGVFGIRDIYIKVNGFHQSTSLLD